MNRRFSTFIRAPSRTHAMTWTSQNDPSRHSQVDSAGSTLQHSTLVVEDDPSVSQLLMAALGTWGYDVFLAKNGREGLHVLTKQVVDGILLDINMPVMDGLMMLDELRRLRYPIPVVIMSGGVKGSDLRQLENEGAQGFMSKPFSLSFLRDVCATIFENQGVEGCSRIGEESSGINFYECTQGQTREILIPRPFSVIPDIYNREAILECPTASRSCPCLQGTNSVTARITIRR